VTDLRGLCSERFNRNGTLCGKCKHGYHPLAYSYNSSCVLCPGEKYHWLAFALASFLPLTIFYFIIVFFEVNVTSSYLHGYVFYCQIVSMPTIVRVLYNALSEPAVLTALKWVIGLYGIWNLDFFRSADLNLCVRAGTSETLALDLIVGFYPLLLMVLSYLLIQLHNRNFRLLVIAWKPFRALSQNWGARRTSLIDAFATFFLLSNVKFQSASFDLLVPVRVYQLSHTGNYTSTLRLYYDATLPYFGDRHLPYAILGILIFLIFAALPTLLLVLYPYQWFQKFLGLFPTRWYNVLRTFVDSFQGCYKDGTEPGTRDYRWFAGMFFFSRYFLMLVGGYTLSSMFYPMAAILLVLLAILLILLQPFKQKKRHLTYINVSFSLLLALWYIGLIGILKANHSLSKPYFVIASIAGVFPLFVTVATFLHWICCQSKFNLEIMRRIHFWRHGYSILE
jgi:hypothetical protein